MSIALALNAGEYIHLYTRDILRMHVTIFLEARLRVRKTFMTPCFALGFESAITTSRSSSCLPGRVVFIWGTSSSANVPAEYTADDTKTKQRLIRHTLLAARSSIYLLVPSASAAARNASLTSHPAALQEFVSPRELPRSFACMESVEDVAARLGIRAIHQQPEPPRRARPQYAHQRRSWRWRGHGQPG